MGWKDWPYWSKGLIIGICLAIILFVLQAIIGLGCMDNYNLNQPSFVCNIFNFGFSNEVSRLLFSPVFVIVVCTMIGLIIGKIKKK